MKEESTGGDWPNWRRGAIVGFIAGLTLAVAWIGWLGFVSTLPTVSPVALSLAVSPWYRASNWESAGFVFVTVGGFVTLLVALRPATRNRNR